MVPFLVSKVLFYFLKKFSKFSLDSVTFLGKKQNLIRDICRNRGIIITSYVGVLQLNEELLRYDWHYVVLDEGHKIRNPDAKVSDIRGRIRKPLRAVC